MQWELAQRRAIDAGDGRTVYAFDERPYVAIVVGLDLGSLAAAVEEGAGEGD